jgi:hypothetical protein
MYIKNNNHAEYSTGTYGNSQLTRSMHLGLKGDGMDLLLFLRNRATENE